MTKIEVEIPDDVVIPQGHRAVFKEAKNGDLFISKFEGLSRWNSVSESFRHIVLEPIWQPPAFIRKGWIARIKTGYWIWFSKKPYFDKGVWRCSDGIRRTFSPEYLNIDMPNVEPEDSLFECKGSEA